MTLVRYKREDDLDGIGFMLTEDDPIVGIDDIVEVVDPETGDIIPEARWIILTLSTYTEFSPSGTGLHVLTLAQDDLPDHWRTRNGLDCSGPLEDAPQIEVYESGQYLSVTGDVLDGYETIGEGGDALTAIGEQYLAPDDPVAVSDGTDAPSPFENDSGAESTTDLDGVNTDVDPDPHRIRRTLEEYATVGSEDAQRALDLWRSSASDPMGQESPSEADLEFAWRLAFWCRNGDRLIKRCIRTSHRYRAKWDRDSYGQATIKTAVQNNHRIFRGRYVPN